MSLLAMHDKHRTLQLVGILEELEVDERKIGSHIPTIGGVT